MSDDGKSARVVRRVLFVCTGNTSRSVLAEYLGRKFCDDVFTCESAGIRPQRAEHASNAVFVLRQAFGMDASAHQPRDVRGLDLCGFDLIVAIEDNAAAVVRELGVPESKLQVWVALVVIGLTIWRAVYFIQMGRHNRPRGMTRTRVDGDTHQRPSGH
jgi:protein-tyrosine-phosphatase